jgi:uncharacterized protein YndB with AHSA1/START domain
MTDSNALNKGERSIVIEAPCDVVYNYLSDFTQHPEWNYQPTEITKVTDGPMDVGTVFRTEERPPGKVPWIIRKVVMPLMLRFAGFQGYTEAEITALEPGRRLAWKAAAPLQNGGYFMKADWEILLEPQNGGTLVRQRYHYKPEHVLAKGAESERGVKSTVEEVDANLARLKEIVERRTAGA